MTYYVYSTSSADTQYNFYHHQDTVVTHEPGVAAKPVGLPVVTRSILIKGGSSVAPAGIRKLETPYGVITQISDEEAEILKNHKIFNDHIKGGYIKILKHNVHPEKIVTDGMESRDDSAPLTEADMFTVGNINGEVKKEITPTGRFKKPAIAKLLQ